MKKEEGVISVRLIAGADKLRRLRRVWIRGDSRDSRTGLIEEGREEELGPPR